MWKLKIILLREILSCDIKCRLEELTVFEDSDGYYLRWLIMMVIIKAVQCFYLLVVYEYMVNEYLNNCI